MKGILKRRTNDGKWVVMYNRIPGSFDMLELHPDQKPLAGFHYTKELEGKEVEFEVVNGGSWTDAPYGAKLILPKEKEDDMDEFNSVGDYSLHPKAPTETWADIVQAWLKAENDDTFVEYLEQHYFTPIKK